MVHLGVGGFHRSHQAVYTDLLLHYYENQKDAEPDEVFGICGMGLMPWDSKMYQVPALVPSCLRCVSLKPLQRPAVHLGGDMNPKRTLLLRAPGVCLRCSHAVPREAFSKRLKRVRWIIPNDEITF